MLLTALLAVAATAAPLEQRCGWLQNPTPGNWWLTDRDGQWTFSTQGRPAVLGWEELPATGPKQWVRTNGYYGYGCACARMRVSRSKREVLEVRALSGRPLAVCRGDRRLPKP